MAEFLKTIISAWWGVAIVCAICAAAWIALSAVLYTRFFKRFYDIVLSMIAIVVLSPLLAILTVVGAIAMKGNPFFMQKRPGVRKKLSKKECAERGVPFGTYGEEKVIRLLKFRTMTDARDGDGNLLPDWQRLNAYGKFLRTTSLDELLSVFNILCGSITIVGPRPQLIKDMWFMSDEIRKRHNVYPGLTGLAQANGRNAIGWDEKFTYDLQYIEKISLWKDCVIVLKTVIKVFKRSEINRAGTASDLDYGDWLLAKGDITRDEYDKILALHGVTK